MALQARTRPLVGKYAFTVHDTSYGIREAKFQKCTGIEMTINMGEYREGGAQMPMKEATTASVSNATLEHGVMENSELYTWVKQVIDTLAFFPEGWGVRSPNQLRNLAIRQLRRDRSMLRQTTLYNCQPAKFVPGEYDNSSSDVQVETLEIAYEFFDVQGAIMRSR